jgi:hypothetical protein
MPQNLGCRGRRPGGALEQANGLQAGGTLNRALLAGCYSIPSANAGCQSRWPGCTCAGNVLAEHTLTHSLTNGWLSFESVIDMQAVEADGRGALDQAKELYFKLLECLTRCHALEPAPACQAAIMSRFKVGRPDLKFRWECCSPQLLQQQLPLVGRHPVAGDQHSVNLRQSCGVLHGVCSAV